MKIVDAYPLRVKIKVLLILLALAALSAGPQVAAAQPVAACPCASPDVLAPANRPAANPRDQVTNPHTTETLGDKDGWIWIKKTQHSR